MPGHDLSMVLDEAGKPAYCGKRKAAIAAWFRETLSTMSVIDLTEESAPGVRI